MAQATKLQHSMSTTTVYDSALAAERSRAYRGHAKVQIQYLKFEDDNQMGARALDSKNIARLVQIFELEGCFRLEPEHYVPALVNRQALDAVLSEARMNATDLLQCGEPPTLNINFPLVCLHGKHRLHAAGQFLNPNDKWWVVDLYLDGLHRCPTVNAEQCLISVCRSWVWCSSSD